VQAKETSCRVTDAIIKYTRAEGGDVGELLEGFPYDETFLTDTNNWVPLTASNELFERLRKLFNDQNVTYKVGLASVRLEAGGTLQKVTRLLGNPKFIVAQAPRLQANLTHTSDLSVSNLTDTSATIEIAYRPGVKHIDRDSCDFARGVLTSIPEWCALPAADLHEERCHIPVQERGPINGYIYRVDDEKQVWRYPAEAGEEADGELAGRLNSDGSFRVGQTLYGSSSSSCLYHLTWQRVESGWRHWWNQVFGKSQADAIRAREDAINELLRANELIEKKSEELTLANLELQEKSEELARANQATQQRAEELARTNEELEQRSEQLALINRMSQGITASLELDIVLETAATAIHWDFPYDHVSIYLIDKSFNETVLKAMAGCYVPSLSKEERHSTERGIVGWVARHGEKQLATGVNAAILHGDEFADTESELCMPIRVGGETIGVLDLHSSREDAFDEDDISAMETLSTQIGAAIRNAQLFKRIQEATRFKSEFLANISHELRTPLNTIIGFSDLLITGKSGGPLPPEQKSDVEKIMRSSRHLLNLINDILDISKIEAGKMELWKDTFDFRDICRDVTPIANNLIGEKEIIFKVKVAEELPLLYADKIRVKQIVLNLLSNAVKFTRRGKIVLGAGVRGGMAHISVADTGIGIAKEDTDRIFETFQQVDGTETREAQGSGLGLAICKSLVEMHGGRIWVESEGLGRGSRFIFTLPLIGISIMPPGGVTLPSPSSALETGATASPATRVTPAPSRVDNLVLAIDDDHDVINLLKRTLAGAGYEVVGAASGDEGLQLAQELQPTVITLDIKMPDKNGWETLKEIKNTPGIADIPVVIISIADGLEHGFSMGAADYMVKPIDGDVLLGKLERFTARRILVVDDDPNDLELISRTLQEAGYSTEVAQDGVEALEKIRNFQPAALVLDLMMPRLNGFEVVARLRADRSADGLCIVILTAKELTTEEQDFLQEQVERVIQKGSLPREALLQSLQESLERLKPSPPVAEQVPASPPPPLPPTALETDDSEPEPIPAPETDGSEPEPTVPDDGAGDLEQSLLEQRIALVTEIPEIPGNEKLSCNILLVEDKESTVQIVQRVLEGAEEINCQLTVLHDGQEAIEFLDAPQPYPDLILLDILMPRLSGYEVAKRIKSDPSLKDIPVVALTAAAMVHQRQKALEAGCDDVISKPFEPQNLLAYVVETLQEKELK
jgi:CheY-like chemotaxis protein/signal transduction histidine kinase